MKEELKKKGKRKDQFHFMLKYASYSLQKNLVDFLIQKIWLINQLKLICFCFFADFRQYEHQEERKLNDVLSFLSGLEIFPENIRFYSFIMNIYFFRSDTNFSSICELEYLKLYFIDRNYIKLKNFEFNNYNLENICAKSLGSSMYIFRKNQKKDKLFESEPINLRQIRSFSKKKENAIQFQKKNLKPQEFDENHISQTLQMNEWTSDDEKQLFSLFQKQGSCWTSIGKKLGGRNDNFVKNKFYGAIRRLLRKINTFIKEIFNTKLKPISYQSIMKIIEVSQSQWEEHHEIKQISQSLKNQFFSFMFEKNREQVLTHFRKFVEDVHRFNLKTRCFSFRKKSLFKNSKKSNHNFGKNKKQKELMKQTFKDPSQSQFKNSDLSLESFCEMKQIQAQFQSNSHYQGFIEQCLDILNESNTNTFFSPVL